MLIDQNQVPQVAVAAMNKTHADEIEIVNALHEMIASYLAEEKVGQQLDEQVERFARHVEQHFSNEEQLMRETGFPAFAVHKGEHDRVRGELAPLFEAWRTQRNIKPLADYLQNIHPQWAKNHIATMDTMTALFISQTRPDRV